MVKRRSGGGATSTARRALVTLSIAAAVVGVAACETGKQARGLRLTDIDGYLEFVARDRESNQKSKVGTTETISKETIFEQNLGLETEGYVYHPNFLEFTLGGLFGLLQRQNEDTLSGQRRSSSEDGTVLEFDLSANLLKKKEYPGTVFARRYRALEPRPFRSSLETTTTTYGLIWQYVDPKVPTTFQLNSTDVRLDPLDNEEQGSRHKNEQIRLDTGYRFTDHNTFSLNYDRRSVAEEPFKLDYDSDEVTLSHLLLFGPNHRQRLESELNYFDQRGTFDIRRARWRETLRLEHSDTLRSWYQFEALDRKQGTLSGVAPIQERSYSLSGTLEHKLFESLVSQFFGFAQTQSFESGLDIDRYGVYADFDYRKKNPWGELRSRYRIRYRSEERSGNDRAIEINDQRNTFQDPDPITLTESNIDAASIRITDEQRTTLYQLNSDYTVRTFPNYVEIERVPTGRIADGEVVLIDYVFVLGGNFTLDTVNHEFSISQHFDFGLQPYYRLRRQNQSVTPGDAQNVTPEDITAHTVGVEFRRSSLRLLAEYEDYDSNIVPSRTLRLSADYTRRFKFGATGIVAARWSDATYPSPINRSTRFFTLEGRWRHPITDKLTVEGAVLYRRERDSLSGNEEGFDLDLSLEWKIRRTDIKVTYEASEFDDNFARNDNQRLYVQVKRSF